MEPIMHGLESNNGILVAITLIILVLLIIMCVKSNILKIHTNKFSMGKSSEIERAIIRHQIEWAHLTCVAFEDKVPKSFEGYDYYRSKYILEKVYDEVVNWIIFNHIETTDTYIKLKQDIIWKIVLSNTNSSSIRTTKFQKEVFNEVQKLIENLLIIRQEYEEE